MAFSDQSEAVITLFYLTNQRNDKYLCFQVLIGILQRRIELDKEVLFQFNTIKHEAGLVDLQEKNPTIAPTLMKFQRGCHQVSGNNYFDSWIDYLSKSPTVINVSVSCSFCHADKTGGVMQNMTILHPANQSQVSEGAEDQSAAAMGATCKTS